jgi:hypothetical protein
VNKELTDALRTLNRSVRHLADATEVADWLIEQGVKGIPKDCRVCPLSNWYRGELRKLGLLGRRQEVSVTSVVSVLDLDRDQQVIAEVDLPAAFSDFITAFDSGAYKELSDATGGVG